MTKEQANSVAVGHAVMCNGQKGSITDVHTGQLSGMVTVRLDRGSVCVGLSDAGLYPLKYTPIDDDCPLHD